MDIKNAKIVHFIGIGGIGISAVARMMMLEGKKVSGSDRSVSKVTDELEKAGATIYIGHSAEQIPGTCDLVVYTHALSEDNPELVKAKEMGIDILTYPQTLDYISKEKYTIAVSGTHGKTTVTAMIAKVLMDAGLDPSVIVGSLINNPDGSSSNFIAGKSKYLVVEADEYKKSFHNLHPTILVINNVDEDHLDFYKDLSDIQDSFREVALKVPKEGCVIVDREHENVKPVVEGLKTRVINYREFFDQDLALKVPGKHNKLNAAAALAVTNVLGVDILKAKASLAAFAGTWRRFEFKGKTAGGALVYDDYAHNPQKVLAALEGARELFPNKKIVVMFQSHLYSRTKLLLPQFAKAFSYADYIFLAPIFPAREVFDGTITSEILAEAIKKERGDTNVEALPDFDSIEKSLRERFNSDEYVIMTIGAGDGYRVAEALVV